MSDDLPDAPWATEDMPTQPKGRSWSDVPMEAAGNVLESGKKFASDLVQPILHPIETYENIRDLGHGALQKAGVMSGEEDIPKADALGKFFADRYGGQEALKKTMAEDPVGFLGDLSMVLTGGGTAAARAPGIAGKLGRAAATAGRAVDPVTIATKPVELAGHMGSRLASEAAGVATGVGNKPIDEAFNAGYTGGASAKEFRDNMRGNVPLGKAVDDAENALRQLRINRGLDYGVGMAVFNMANQNKVLNFNRVDNAIQNAGVIKRFKGIDLDPATAAIRDQLDGLVSNWKTLNPQDYHTPEGFDALKQQIGSIRDATQYGTPERVVADRYYNAVRKSIIDAAPAYGKIMKGYEEASDTIREIEKTLSLSPEKGTGPVLDTTLRKLQSILRNNVNTSYGHREQLAKYLMNAGAPHLLEALAGQALNQWAPRGTQRGVTAAELGAAIVAMMSGNSKMAAGLVGTAMASSPRLVGESAYYAGRAANPAGMVYDASKAVSPYMFQTGRMSEVPGMRYGGAVKAIAKAKAR